MSGRSLEERLEAIELEVAALRRKVGLLRAAVVFLLIGICLPPLGLTLVFPLLFFGIAFAVIFFISGIMSLLDLIWGPRPQTPGPPVTAGPREVPAPPAV